MKKGIISWRIAVVILFIFGMGFVTGKLTEISRINKLQGYKINISTIESDAMMSQEMSTSSDVETSTPSNVEASTPSDVETSTPSDAKPSTPSGKEESKTEEEKTEEKDLVYNSEKITSKEIQEIKNAKSAITVTIKANNDTVIEKAVFDAIKGTNKKIVVIYKEDQISFNGKDIEETKDVDVVIEKRLLTTEDKIDVKEAIEEGVLIVFKDNGKLPASATVRLTLTDEMKKIADDDKFNLYYYNEKDGVLELVQKKVDIIENSYVLLKISHNSKYILATESAISEKVPVVDVVVQEDVVSFVDDNITYLLVIGASLMVIVSVTIVLLISRKPKNKI